MQLLVIIYVEQDMKNQLMLRLLQIKSTKCTLIIVQFYKACSHTHQQIQKLSLQLFWFTQLKPLSCLVKAALQILMPLASTTYVKWVFHPLFTLKLRPGTTQV
jgi:hypothetical protein